VCFSLITGRERVCVCVFVLAVITGRERESVCVCLSRNYW
jgi:hypothetical protein